MEKTNSQLETVTIFTTTLSQLSVPSCSLSYDAATILDPILVAKF